MAVVVDTTAERVLDVARAELGTHENPFGSNKTPYGAWYGMNGVAWCNIFVTWVLHHAGAEEIPKFAYTPSSAKYFQDKGAWLRKHERPQPGDLVWFDFPRDGVDRISHIGFVEGVLADGRIATIEGNTNEKGGRTGGRVMRHNRSVSGGIVGFGKITYLESSEEEEEMAEKVRLVVYADPNDPQRGHTYSVFGNQAKWMAHEEDVKQTIAMGVELISGPLPVHPFQGGVIFVDGPLKNLS